MAAERAGTHRVVVVGAGIGGLVSALLLAGNLGFRRDLVNQAERGPVTGLRLALALQTGDNSDNSQYNEVRWNIDVLDGGAGNDALYGHSVSGAGDDNALMSSTAIILPCESYTGLVVQVNGMWVASKWSSRCTVSAWPVLMQVPTPQVPACASLQSAPR